MENVEDEFDKEKIQLLNKELDAELLKTLKMVEEELQNDENKNNSDEIIPELSWNEVLNVFEDVAATFNEHHDGNKVNMTKLKDKMAEDVDFTKIFDGKITVALKKDNKNVKNEKNSKKKAFLKLKKFCSVEKLPEWISK